MHSCSVQSNKYSNDKFKIISKLSIHKIVGINVFILVIWELYKCIYVFFFFWIDELHARSINWHRYIRRTVLCFYPNSAPSTSFNSSQRSVNTFDCATVEDARSVLCCSARRNIIFRIEFVVSLETSIYTFPVIAVYIFPNNLVATGSLKIDCITGNKSTCIFLVSSRSSTSYS